MVSTCPLPPSAVWKHCFALACSSRRRTSDACSHSPRPFMPASAVLVLVLALAAPDTTMEPVAQTPAGPTATGLAVAVRVPDDTVRRRRRAIEVSDWYERRLRIHRYGSYLVYPLFAGPALAGNQNFQDPRRAAARGKNTPPPAPPPTALLLSSCNRSHPPQPLG